MAKLNEINSCVYVSIDAAKVQTLIQLFLTMRNRSWFLNSRRKKTSIVVKVVQFNVNRKLPETSGSVVHSLVEMLPK